MIESRYELTDRTVKVQVLCDKSGLGVLKSDIAHLRALLRPQNPDLHPLAAYREFELQTPKEPD